MKVVLYIAIGLILITFLADHARHGWYRPIGEAPDETGVTLAGLWTPVDVGSLFVLGSVILASAAAILRFLRSRTRTQQETGTRAPREAVGAMGVLAKVMLWLGIGIILATFFADHLRHGFLGVAEEVTTTPSGADVAVTTVRWTPVDLACYLVVVYLVIVLAKATIRLVRARAMSQR